MKTIASRPPQADRAPPMTASVGWVAGLAVLIGFGAGGWILRDGFTSGVIWGYRDAFHYYAPLEAWIGSELRAGRLPLWCRWENLGTAMADEPSTSLFDPWRVVLGPTVPLDLRIKLRVVAHLVIAAVGAWALFRTTASRKACPTTGQIDRRSSHQDLSQQDLSSQGLAHQNLSDRDDLDRLRIESSAGFVGLAYALAGPVLFSYSNPIYLVGAAWLPWTLNAAVRIGRGPVSVTTIMLLAASLALPVMGGDPQAALHAGLLAGGLAWAESHRRNLPRARGGRTGGWAGWLARCCRGTRLNHPARPPFGAWPRFSWRTRRGALTLGALAAAALAAVQIGATVTSSVVPVRAAEPGPRSVLECLVAGALTLDSPTTGAIPSEALAVPPHNRPSLASLVEPPRNGNAAAEIWNFSVHPIHGAEWLMPGVFGTTLPPWTRWSRIVPGDGWTWTPTLFAGTWTACLALAGLVGAGGPAVRAWRWAMVLTFAFACGNLMPWTGPASVTGVPTVPVASPYGALIAAVPGYWAFRYPAKWLVPFALSVAMVAGHVLLAERRAGVAARSGGASERDRSFVRSGWRRFRQTDFARWFKTPSVSSQTFGHASSWRRVLPRPSRVQAVAALVGLTSTIAWIASGPLEPAFRSRLEGVPASSVLGPLDIEGAVAAVRAGTGHAALAAWTLLISVVAERRLRRTRHREASSDKFGSDPSHRGKRVLGHHVGAAVPILAIGLELAIAHAALAPGLPLPAEVASPTAATSKTASPTVERATGDGPGRLLRDDRVVLVPAAWRASRSPDRLAEYEQLGLATRLSRLNLFPDPATGRPTDKLGTSTSLDDADLRAGLDLLGELTREQNTATSDRIATPARRLADAWGVARIITPASVAAVSDRGPEAGPRPASLGTAQGSMSWATSQATHREDRLPHARLVPLAWVLPPLETSGQRRNIAAIAVRTRTLFALGRDPMRLAVIEADRSDLPAVLIAPENATGDATASSTPPSEDERSPDRSGSPTGPEHDRVSTVDCLDDQATRQRWLVRTDRPALLVVADRYDPDWTVTLRTPRPEDGVPRADDGTARTGRLLRCERLIRAVAVPVGVTEVTLTYRPWRLLPGAILSGLAWSILLGTLASRAVLIAVRMARPPGRYPVARSPADAPHGEAKPRPPAPPDRSDARSR